MDFYNTTFRRLPQFTKRRWYVIDCKDKQLGRLASTIVEYLTGKSSFYYNPSLDEGNYIILINTEYLKLNRDIERFHVFQPGHPGKSLKRLVNIMPKQIIENCVFNMLPNGFPKKHLVKRLKIYQGDQHPHVAQNPKQLHVL
jgi:large subunit ribosomal protein L13